MAPKKIRAPSTQTHVDEVVEDTKRRRVISKTADTPRADEDDDADEKQDSKTRRSSPAEVVEARSATKELAKKQKVVDKLQSERDELAKRVKINRDALRVAEKELEDARECAKKKSKVALRAKAEMLGKTLSLQATRLKATRSVATAAFQSAKRRVEDLNDGVKSAQSKMDVAKQALALAQDKLADSERLCKQLKEQGETVPEDHEKDLSAPGAWKAPGVKAVKDRARAREVLARAKLAFEKAAAVVAAKQQLQEAAAKRIDTAKLRRKRALEKAQMVDEKLAKLIPVARVKAQAKAKGPPMGKAQRSSMKMSITKAKSMKGMKM